MRQVGESVRIPGPGGCGLVTPVSPFCACNLQPRVYKGDMSMASTLPGYYTIQEASEILGRDSSQVWRYVRDGLLPAVQFGRQWAIEQAEVHGFSPPPRGNPNFRNPKSP